MNFKGVLPSCFSGHGWRVFTSGLSLIWKVEMPLLQKSCVKDLESFWQIKWSSFDLLSERPFKRTGKENLSSKHKRNRNTWSKKSTFLQASSNVGMDVKNRQSQHLFASNTKTNKYAFYYLRPRTLGRLKMVKMKISQWASVFLWFRCFKKIFFFVWGEFLIGGNGFENFAPCSRENGAKISKKRKMAKNQFSRSDLGS